LFSQARTGASLDLIVFHLARSRSLSVYRTGTVRDNRIVNDATALRFRTVMRTWGLSRFIVNDVIRHKPETVRHFVNNVLTHRNGERFRDLQQKLLSIADHEGEKNVLAAIIAAMVATSADGKEPVYNPLTLHLRADWRAAMVDEVAPAIGVDGDLLLQAFTMTARKVCNAIAAKMDHDGSYRSTHKQRFDSKEVADQQKNDLFQHSKLRRDASDGECEIYALKLYLTYAFPVSNKSRTLKLASVAADTTFWWCFPLKAVEPILKSSEAGGPPKHINHDDIEQQLGDLAFATMLAKLRAIKKRAHDEMSEAHESPNSEIKRSNVEHNVAATGALETNAGAEAENGRQQ
jgi:hypothetical protein